MIEKIVILVFLVLTLSACKSTQFESFHVYSMKEFYQLPVFTGRVIVFKNSKLEDRHLIYGEVSVDVYIQRDSGDIVIVKDYLAHNDAISEIEGIQGFWSNCNPPYPAHNQK